MIKIVSQLDKNLRQRIRERAFGISIINFKEFLLNPFSLANLNMLHLIFGDLLSTWYFYKNTKIILFYLYELFEKI